MPQIIAICGATGSGKSEIQRLLAEHHGFIPVDDKAPLRDICRQVFGLSEWHVTTQEGKRTMIEVSPGVEISVRQILGDMGKFIEREYGEFALCQLAMNKAVAEHGPDARLCFASVRLRQTIYWRDQGGTVLECQSEKGVLKHDFDHYDRSAIHAAVSNCGESPARLLTRTEAALAGCGIVLETGNDLPQLAMGAA